MQHALEADHITAVSSIAARRSHVGDIVNHGLTRGVGRTATLFIFAGGHDPARPRDPRRAGLAN